MGRKISVDSATMMNKALEVIEARWLFDLPPEQIRVVIHPQSIIHSMVVCRDQSVLAQLGTPDMRVPIAYGLAWPERIASGAEPLDLRTVASLSFEAADHARYPALGLAYDALRGPPGTSAVLNAANEEAVAAFLAGTIRFDRIHTVNARTIGGRDPARGRGRLARGAARARCRGAAARGPVPEQLRRIDHRMTPITTVLAFLVTLGVLIVVHEYGHYRVAVACGVKVLRFSVGFGRVLWRRQPRPDSTEFVVCALPLGGYVRMLDEREGPVAPDERHRPSTASRSGSARRSSPPARWPTCCSRSRCTPVQSWIGVEEPKAVLGPPVAASVAERAGLRAGDWVRAVSSDGDDWQDIRSLTDLRWQVMQAVLDGQSLSCA